MIVVCPMHFTAELHQCPFQIVGTVFEAPPPRRSARHHLVGSSTGVVDENDARQGDCSQVVEGEAEPVGVFSLVHPIGQQFVGIPVLPEPRGGGVENFAVWPPYVGGVELETVTRNHFAGMEAARVAVQDGVGVAQSFGTVASIGQRPMGEFAFDAPLEGLNRLI